VIEIRKFGSVSSRSAGKPVSLVIRAIKPSIAAISPSVTA
jgi:hypothetical protein